MSFGRRHVVDTRPGDPAGPVPRQRSRLHAGLLALGIVGAAQLPAQMTLPSPRLPPAGLAVEGVGEDAELRFVTRKVDGRPPEEPWSSARVGDRLARSGGVRTHEKSFAELILASGGRVVVGESSQIVLLDTGASAGPGRSSFELVLGQADVTTPPGAPRDAEIEVIAGDVRFRGRPGRQGGLLARVRRTPTAVVLAVFEGVGEASVGSTRATLVQGQGTTFTKGASPAVETLLGPPLPSAPSLGAVLDYANPRFFWDAVPGAASHTIEICRDAACTQLLERVGGIVGGQWTSAKLPLGELHWRVAAMSRGGVDGVPSATVSFVVRSLWQRPLEKRGP